MVPPRMQGSCMSCGSGVTGVADADVHVEGGPGRGQPGSHAHTHTLLVVLLADHFSGGVLRVEGDSIVHAGGGDVRDSDPDRGGLVADGLCLEVDVAVGRRSPKTASSMPPLSTN